MKKKKGSKASVILNPAFSRKEWTSGSGRAGGSSEGKSVGYQVTNPGNSSHSSGSNTSCGSSTSQAGSGQSTGGGTANPGQGDGESGQGSSLDPAPPVWKRLVSIDAACKKALYVPSIPETGGGTDPDNEMEETVKVSVSLNPATVNVGENLSDGQIQVSLIDAKTGKNLGQTKEYTTDFTPQMTAGEYPFHVTCRGITLTVRAVLVDPSQNIQSISVSYNGPHGKYLVMEEGVDPACLDITAVMKDDSSRNLTGSEISVSSVEMAAYDGGMTKVHLILMGKTTGLAQIPSYHKDSLTGESSLQKNHL